LYLNGAPFPAERDVNRLTVKKRPMAGDPLLGDGFSRHDLRDVLHPRGAWRRDKKKMDGLRSW